MQVFILMTHKERKLNLKGYEYLAIIQDVRGLECLNLKTLFPAERAEASKRKNKAIYLQSRGLIKSWLSVVYDLRATDIEVSFDTREQQLKAHYNKRFLSNISLSHSRHFVAIAIPLNCNGIFGIDLEFKKQTRHFSALSQIMCTDKERLDILDSLDICSAFYHHWTLKEALTKATKKALEEMFQCDSQATLKTQLLRCWSVERDEFVCSFVCPIKANIKIIVNA